MRIRKRKTIQAAATQVGTFLRKLDHFIHTSVHLVSPLLLSYFIVQIRDFVPTAVTITLVVLLVLYLLLLVVTEALPRIQRRKISLTEKWQALAWTHYRRLLSELTVLASTRRGDSNFDFVTFSSGQFFERLTTSGLSELQYSRHCTRRIDFVICDIEDVDDLKAGVLSSEPNTPVRFSPANLEVLFGDRSVRAAIQEFLCDQASSELSDSIQIPKAFAPILQRRTDQPETLGIPLRWGYTGVALKLSVGTRESLANEGFDLTTHASFDLEWLFTDNHALRRWAVTNKAIVALDWYLPVMLLLSWYEIGLDFHTLNQEQFKRVTCRLNSLGDLVHGLDALCDDPLRLINRVREQRDVIIIGGGNWLRSSRGEEKDELIILPIKQGMLLWCECLVFLAPNPHSRPAKVSTAQQRWDADARKLVKWLLEQHQDFAGEFAFSAYAPSDMSPVREILDRARASHANPVAQVRKLPPKQSLNYVCRHQWEEAWEHWKDQLKLRGSPNEN